MTDIVRVWGSCDKIQVEFKYEGGKQWSCTVPPDLKDGIYVAEFWAQDDQGRIGHWTGFLYMSSGICHFKFNQEKYQFWLNPLRYIVDFNKKKLYQVDFHTKEWKFAFSTKIEPLYKVSFNPCKYSITFNEKDNNFNIKFNKNKYSVDIFKTEEKFDRRDCIIFKDNIHQFLLKRQQARQLANKITAKLGIAILGKMILGHAGDEVDNTKTKKYQINFYTNNYKAVILKPKHKIFFEKRCKHWEP